MLLKPIGLIHSPFKKKEEAPRQVRLSEKIFNLENYPDDESG